MRRDSTTGWLTNQNVVLGRGEFASEYYDNNVGVYGALAGTEVGFKIGDGVRRWRDLPYHRQDPGINPNGRAQRDLSVFGRIGQAGTARSFTTIWEAVDAILHPYVPPTISLSGTSQGDNEIGYLIPSVTLTLDVSSSGSFPLREKTIYDAVINSDLQSVVGNPTTNASISHLINNLGANTTTAVSTRSFGGRVVNTRVSPGNETVYSNNIGYSFYHPIVYGFTTQDIRTLDNARMSSFLFGGFNGGFTNANRMTQFLSGGNGKQITFTGTVNAEHVIYAYPQYLGPLVLDANNPRFYQVAAINGPILADCTRIDAVLTQQTGGPYGGAWVNIPYYIYYKNSVTGSGGPLTFRATN